MGMLETGNGETENGEPHPRLQTRSPAEGCRLRAHPQLQISTNVPVLASQKTTIRNERFSLLNIEDGYEEFLSGLEIKH
jgi:hypothetical protein